MGTQWRSGMSGPTGLDYGVLPQVMDWLHVPRKARVQLFDDVRTMESAALSEIHKKA